MKLFSFGSRLKLRAHGIIVIKCLCYVGKQGDLYIYYSSEYTSLHVELKNKCYEIRLEVQ